MIDIDEWEARMTRRDDEPLSPPSPEEVLSLLAEIRRLRGTMEHRKCVECGHDGFLSAAETGLGMRYWIQCSYCGDTGLIGLDESEAWAAWDGVE